MRWFTCTPVDFDGGPDFFTRDSGLLCRGFQSLGIKSKAVMPGVSKSGDEADLIRTEFHNLESSDWWQSHQLDGVVLYAWGRPVFRKVAEAIRNAGIFLVLNQDNGGAISPLAGFRDWMREQWILTGQGGSFGSLLNFGLSTAKGLTLGLALTDPLRASHLSCGNVIACVSPKAAERYRKLCLTYRGESLADRVSVIPHAVETRFQHLGGKKLFQVACVGRWDDFIQKRPSLLVNTIGALLHAVDDVTIVIAGSITEMIQEWHQGLEPTQRDRVKLKGVVPRDELASILADSQIFYSPSAFESFGIAAAESLCSGCSVVGAKSVSMAGFEWFVSESCGTLALKDDTAGHLAALICELYHWQEGNRDPTRISAIWCERLHSDKVAGRIIQMHKGKVSEKLIQIMDFTIITPNLNYGRFLGDCLDSVANQQGVTLEHLVIDGGSTDASAEIAARFRNVVWTSEKDDGMSNAINKGFERAVGDWVMWLNADDKLKPGVLAELLQLGATTDSDVIYGDWDFVDRDGSFIRTIRAPRWSNFVNVHHHCCVGSTAAIYRKSSIISEGFRLREDFRFVMDGEFYARLHMAGKKFERVPLNIADFRMHGANASQRHLGGTRDMEHILAAERQHVESRAIRRAYGVTLFEDPYLNGLVDGLLWLVARGWKTVRKS